MVMLGLCLVILWVFDLCWKKVLFLVLSWRNWFCRCVFWLDWLFYMLVLEFMVRCWNIICRVCNWYVFWRMVGCWVVFWFMWGVFMLFCGILSRYRFIIERLWSMWFLLGVLFLWFVWCWLLMKCSWVIWKKCFSNVVNCWLRFVKLYCVLKKCLCWLILL